MAGMFKKLIGSFDLYRGLSRPIYVLFWCSLINGIGSFVFPFLTMYLTSRLNLSDRMAGVYMMYFACAYVPGALIGGKIADKFRRKTTVFIAQLIMSLILLACGFLDGNPVIIYLLIILEVFDGICDPARDALCQDVTTPENRQAAFSLTYLAHNLGYIIGPIIAGILFFKAPSWIFWGTGLASILSVFLLVVLVPESKPDAETVSRSMVSNDADKAEAGGLIKALLTRPRLIIFAFSIMFISTAYRQVLFALPLTMVRQFGEIGSTLYGTVNSTNGLVVVLFTAPIIAILHRRHPLKNVMLGTLFYFFGFSFIGLFKTPWLFYMTAVVFTFGEIIESTNTKYYVANHTPITHRARFQSILPVIMYSGSAFGPWIAGAISSDYGLQYIWPISGLFIILGCLGSFIVYRMDKKDEIQHPSL